MPQADYIQWDRVWLLKLMATFEMTFSSILLFLYGYLSVLQDWTSTPDERYNILEYRWLIMATTVLDFGLGSLLAYAANLVKKFRRPRVLLWVVFDSLLLPVNIFLMRGMNYELENSVPLSTDIHLRRTLLVHTVYASVHLLFITFAINFLAYYCPKIKQYDPSTRPDSVFEPTDPQITTTESRHIRFSESFLQSNPRRPVDLEASTSTKNQIQLHRAVSTKFGFYRISLLPLFTALWVKRVSCMMSRPRWKKSDESAATEALIQIRTRSTVYSILGNFYGFGKACCGKQEN